MNSKFAMYILKRFGMAVLTIFLVIAITFFVMHAIPASPFSSEKAKSDETIAALEAKYGFDKPVPVQFLNYLKNIARGDFGLSTKWIGSTVIDLIKGGFAYSAKLGLCAALMAIVTGVILGALAALKRGKALDKIIQVITTALVSMPSFVRQPRRTMAWRSRPRLASSSYARMPKDSATRATSFRMRRAPGASTAQSSVATM